MKLELKKIEIKCKQLLAFSIKVNVYFEGKQGGARLLNFVFNKLSKRFENNIGYPQV